MKKLFKIIFLTITVLVLFVVVLAAVLPVVIDPNAYKSEIETLVKEKTGRTLTISGDIKWSVFPWLGFSTGQLVLSNAPGFADKAFAGVAQSEIKVRLLPLFSQEIQVRRIVLKGLRLNLQKNKQGVVNWADLSGDGEQNQQSGSALPALAALVIGGISIVDAQIGWQDKQAGQEQRIDGLNLHTGPVRFNQPVDVDLAFTWDDSQNQRSYQFQLSSQLMLDEELAKITLDKLLVAMKLEGESIPGGQTKTTLTTNLILDRSKQSVNINHLRLINDDLDLDARFDGLGSWAEPRVSGKFQLLELNPRQLIRRLQQTLPPMRDSQALTRLSMQSRLRLTDKQIRIDDISIHLDDTHIEGNIGVSSFANPEFDFNVSLDQLDMDRYLPPAEVSGQDTVAAAAPPGTAVAAGLNRLPVDRLKKLNARGELYIKQLIINKMRLEAITLKLDADNGAISSQQDVQQFYQGVYTGDVKLNVKDQRPVLALNEHLSNVQIEPLLNDLYGKAKMTGVANVFARLNARGDTLEALKSTLNGNMDFKFNHGVIKGFNLARMIEQGKIFFNILKQSPGAADTVKNETEYTEISAHVNISNGLLRNDDLQARSALIEVNGKGTADLKSQRLDYKITAKAIKKKAVSAKAEKIYGVPVVINVSGTFAQPVYKLAIKEMIPVKKQQKILDKVEKKLGKDARQLLQKLF